MLKLNALDFTTLEYTLNTRNWIIKEENVRFHSKRNAYGSRLLGHPVYNRCFVWRVRPRLCWQNLGKLKWQNSGRLNWWNSSSYIGWVKNSVISWWLNYAVGFHLHIASRSLSFCWLINFGFAFPLLAVCQNR